MLAIAKYLVDNKIPSPNGKSDWTSRTVRAVIERSQTRYRGIAYAYKFENTKEFREDRWVAARKRAPLEQQPPLPEGTVERMISDELAAKIAEVNEIMVQEASRNNKHEVTALL
ncbi:recombinase family protein [Ktedonobacter sp. SOSP1-85]|uniref:recombinase family protein n=1 Tax=Ktedonobacter sp. SOSP1-85 TaxID=2778367 RepID=UPI0019152772|nr:recombinase family protein [Ktedonobacter sp. SOSP1-85]